ncbi:MAG: phage portal protein [Anaerolineaceae bacterium]|nr:phage portal protein [Anaerolineaceae bacterium]
MSGILSSIFEKRFHPSQDPPDWVNALSGYQTAAGVSVSESSSLQVSAVFACVRVLAETIASLPLPLYQYTTPRGKEKARDHALYAILHDMPNPEMSSFDMRNALQGHLALRGNAYMEIEQNRAGKIIALWPLRPDRMRIMRKSGKLVYFYRVNAGGEEIPLSSERIFHVRGMGSDGVTGYSPVALARQSIGLAMATEEYGSRYFGNGAQPGGVLEHPSSLKDDAYQRMRKSWEEAHQGLEKSHRVAILEEGVSYKQIGMAPEDSQFLETRKFQVTEIARIFRVPPHMIADLERATFSNIEQMSLEFVMYSLMPWLVCWEQAIYRGLLTEPERKKYFAKFNVAGLLRGDMLSRYQSYAVARQWGFYSANDVREIEDLNPVDGGDEYLVPLNMVPAGESRPLDASSEPGTVSDAGQNSQDNANSGRAAGGMIEKRVITPRAMRSATARHRLVNAYRQVFRDTAARVIRREVNDVRNAAKKYFGQRDYGQFSIWMEEFYREHADFILRQFKPITKAYGELVTAEAADEIALEEYEEEAERFVQSYTGGFAARQTGISQDLLRRVMQKAQDNGDLDILEEMDEELDGWENKRADEIARKEPVRLGNALAKTIYIIAGITRIRSVAFGKNCPYCTGLDGKVIGINQVFLAAGEEYTPDGAEAPLTSTRDIGHPPYHDGCDCGIVAEQ